MKNTYALNSQNQLVSISNVTKGTQDIFHCCNCRDRMIPKKGEINIHHFAHKSVACSPESYLHKLAKLKFFISYSKRLSEKKPFFLEYILDENCNSCDQNLGITCHFQNTSQLYDITKYFDKIEIEKGIDGFIADVLLSSSKTNEK